MSGTSSPPTSADAHYAQDTNYQSPTNYPITRTIAIIQNHALIHRFEIEKRIQEASFEIVKERPMEFDTETDPDTLFELFGEDASNFSEGPVWVYVLERRRAVEVLNTLMGDRDPEVARKDTPNSLRALYGISLQQNGLMGSSDSHSAELQIASIFASSPPFPTTDLPDDQYGTMRSISSSVLQQLATSDEGYAASSATNPSTVGHSRLNTNGKPTFRARPIPATNASPGIVPRSTRSAALRSGVIVEKTESGPRTPLSKERLAETFENVPGHKRRETIAVASTAAPAIAPRMTRAAALRLGLEVEAPKKKLNGEGGKTTFEGVPGHKRRESIAVASVKAPTVAPRLNKSATLRAQKDQGPPPSSMFRGATTPKVPILSRSTSRSSFSPSNPSVAASSPRPAPAARPSSVASTRPFTLSEKTTSISSSDTKSSEGGVGPSSVKARPRPSSVLLNPSIVPRTNRSAALRVAKKEAEAQNAAVAARRGPRTSKLPPTSFKPIAA